MANVTDPLARALHGTDPQNLIEYITRQKIYDSLYWKEECFGLTATEILDKAMELVHVGGSYGGNMQPSRFLCLTLKMLQIQPDDDIIYALIKNEDFKYVRALGAFYLRLTGRPKDVYSYIESLYNDYRKLRLRTVSNTWEIIHTDEFVDSLLRDRTVCGVSLPRLPKREHLVEAGYLDGPRLSVFESSAVSAEQMLKEMGKRGNKLAITSLEERHQIRKSLKRKVGDVDAGSLTTSSKNTLFRESPSKGDNSIKDEPKSKTFHAEDSIGYWNEQRAKLGLNPLKEKK